MAATQPKPTRGQNYGNIARTRLAFDNRSDRSVPLFFEWVIENKIAGMAFPASKEQIVSLKELHGVGSLMA
jgi:ribosomal protein S13